MKKTLLTILLAFTLIFIAVGCDCGGDGAKTYTVTFVQEGFDDVTVTLEAGEILTEVPEPHKIAGYIVEWEDVDFSKIQSDTTIKATVTANEYLIRYHVDDKTTSLYEQKVVYGENYVLTEPVKEGFVFVKWVIKGTDFVFESGTYTKVGDTDLIPVFLEDENSDIHWSGMI